MSRDPRKDPQPGDMLMAAYGSSRVVMSRTGDEIEYRFLDEMRFHHCSVTHWQEWCRKNHATPLSLPRSETSETLEVP